MIVTRIRGGLGNQMFQYAVGRAVSLRLGCALALDLRDWARGQQFDFALNAFQIKARPTDRLPMGRGDSIATLLRKLRHPSGLRALREDGLGYNGAVAQAGPHTLLKGYWQTERYFAKVADQIRADFTLAKAPGPETARLLAEIPGVPAVSLHVRRGDYVSDAKAAQAHGAVGLDYYRAALARIAEAMDQPPVVYAFSDEPDWVRDNIKLPAEIRYVAHNTGATAHEDMILMAACRHHIIANSSFSWWGAWLNPSPDKVVVAPKVWFRKPGQENPDITPPGWLRL